MHRPRANVLSTMGAEEKKRLNAVEIIALTAVAVTAASVLMYRRVSKERLDHDDVMQQERLEDESALQRPRHEREAAERTRAARLGLPKP